MILIIEGGVRSTVKMVDIRGARKAVATDLSGWVVRQVILDKVIFTSLSDVYLDQGFPCDESGGILTPVFPKQTSPQGELPCK